MSSWIKKPKDVSKYISKIRDICPDIDIYKTNGATWDQDIWLQANYKHRHLWIDHYKKGWAIAFCSLPNGTWEQKGRPHWHDYGEYTKHFYIKTDKDAFTKLTEIFAEIDKSAQKTA